MEVRILLKLNLQITIDVLSWIFLFFTSTLSPPQVFEQSLFLFFPGPSEKVCDNANSKDSLGWIGEEGESEGNRQKGAVVEFFFFPFRTWKKRKQKGPSPLGGVEGKTARTAFIEMCLSLPSFKIGSPAKKYTVANNVICCFALPYVRRKK